MQSKKIIVAALLLLLSAPPALAQDDPDAPLNNAAHLTALVHTTRAPRSWKSLKILPGKIEKYYYEFVMPDGTVRIKVQSHPLTAEGVADRRPLSESHPNVQATLTVLQTGAAWGPSIARLW
ncbi:MAG: hypothetical protein K2Y32_00355 [Candidatus Obscuribacterales bacterium]|nr:hypothetical protein [Candidatus Obscuribacterales bacterium]